MSYSTDDATAVRLLLLLLLLVVIAHNALATNNPGHDSLYVLKIGDSNVTGTINLTGNVTATIVQATSRFFGPNVDIRGDGTSSGNANQIIGTATNLELSSSGNLILNKAVTGGQVYVGWPGTTTTLNVTGNILGAGTLNVTGNAYANGAQVCTASNGLCAGAASSAGGWANDSTSTRTTLITIINSSSNAGSFIVQNQSGSVHLFVNGSIGAVGIGASAPMEILHVTGGARVDLAIINLTNLADGSVNSSVTTINVTSTTGYPAIGTVLIDAEALSYATKTTTSFTGVTRGALGTTAANHTSNAIVNSVVEMALRNSTLPVFVATSGGLVGINTTTPGSTLEVKGSMNATNIKVGTTNVCLSDGTNCPAGATGNTGWTNTSGSGNISLTNTGVNVSIKTLFVDNTNGRVGIGTSSPAGSGLTIASGDILIDNQWVLRSKATDGTVAAMLRVGGTNATELFSPGGGILFRSAASNNLSIITDAGLMGIGTTGPTAALQVNSSNVAGSFLVQNTTGSNHLFVNGSTGRVGVGLNNPAQSLDVNGAIAISGTTRIASTGIGTFASGTTVNALNICLIDGTNCPYPSSAGGWINDSTTTRTTLITIVNSSSNAGSFMVQNTTGSSHIFVNGTTGNVALGNTSYMLDKLTVDGSVSIYAHTDPLGARLWLVAPSLWDNSLWTDNATGRLEIHSDNGNAITMSMTQANLVGIGTTAPTATLHVNSSNSAGSFLVQNGTGSNHLFVNGSTGRVGVGLNNPAQSLDVNGAIAISGTTRIASTGIGTFASGTTVNALNICLIDGTNCPYPSSAGGWSNDSTSTRSTLQVIVNSSNVAGSFLVQNTTGSNHLFVNGSTGFVGVGTTAPAAILQTQGGAVLFNGTTGSVPATGAGTRMLWVPSKWALRAGQVAGTDWDDAKVYTGSVGIGKDVQPWGNYTFMAGRNITSADSYVSYTAAFGENNILGVADHALVAGIGNTAGSTSIVAGSTNTVGTLGATFGSSNINSGSTSSILGGFGNTITAAAVNSVIPGGWINVVSGSYAMATGFQAQANGNNSLAIGTNVQANRNYSFVIGSGTASGTVLANNLEQSFMVGFNSTTPTLFVNGSAVGIGTTTPTQAVEVAGKINVSGMIYAYGNLTMKAPNGTLYNCGVSNAGVWSCSWYS
jgi:hypothetical protein